MELYFQSPCTTAWSISTFSHSIPVTNDSATHTHTHTHKNIHIYFILRFSEGVPPLLKFRLFRSKIRPTYFRSYNTVKVSRAVVYQMMVTALYNDFTVHMNQIHSLTMEGAQFSPKSRDKLIILHATITQKKNLHLFNP